MQFTLTIELGNDAMNQPKHVSRALTDIAYDLDHNGFAGEGETVKVRDANGNTVGTWGIKE